MHSQSEMLLEAAMIHMKLYHHTPLGKFFNIELKSIVAQHENLAAKGIFGVRVPLQFFISFRLNKNNPRDFFTEQ